MSELEETLVDTLAASNSQFVSNCEAVHYSLMMTYHELRAVRELLVRAPVGAGLKAQVDIGIRLSEADHKLHVERGTCVNSELPHNTRNASWKVGGGA